jgi:signal transduction histidine kinase
MMRIVTELLNNVHKHSKAKNAYVQFGLTTDELFLTIEDDGIGIKQHRTLSSETSGIGLQTLEDRINGLGGKITIVSEQGTLITIELPLDNLEI